jgi:chromosome segregation ATPase
MAITVDGIHQAADALDGEGIKPTLAAVRARLGGGSFTTISAAMASWRASREQAAALPPAPDEVTARAAALAGEVWAVAAGIAEQRLAGLREELEAERAVLEARAGEAAEVADTLAADLEVERSGRTAAEVTVERLRADLAAAGTAAAVAQARLETLAEAVASEREGLRAGIERAEQAAQAARSERDAAVAGLARAQAEPARRSGPKARRAPGSAAAPEGSTGG